MIYHGIVAAEVDEVDVQRIKSWNMNSIITTFFWDMIETSETDIGVYDKATLDLLRKIVDLEKANGLTPFLGVRVSYGPGSEPGWPTAWVTNADYVNMDPAGRQRYLNFIQMLAEIFPDCGICPWYFPYHGQSIFEETSAEHLTFYNTTLPLLIQKLQEYNIKPIIISPMNQGIAKVDGMRNQSGQYVNTAWIKPEWINDSNIYFNFNTHDGKHGAGTYNNVVQCGEWNRDKAEMQWNYQPVIDFKQANPNVNLISIEFSNLNIHGCTRPATDIAPSRLEWVEANLQIMESLNASWFYYGYSKSTHWATPQLEDGSDSALATLLAQYALTPTPSIIKILAPLSVGLILLYVGSR